LDDVIRELDQLVRLLMNDPSQKMNQQDQIETYEKWKQAIQEMHREQTAQRRETSKVANKDSVLKKLAEQIKKLQSLIEDQQNVLKQTEENESASLRELDKIADQQFNLRQETEKLASDLGQQEQGLDGEGQPGNAESAGEQQSGEQQSGEQQSGEQQSGEQQSGEQQSGEQQSRERQSAQQPQSPPQPGQQPLQRASEHQRNAEEKLGGGRPKDAKREEQKAVAEMEKALDELKKEQRRLASLPPEAFEQMARKQRRTRDKALDLIEKMAKAPAPNKASQQDPNSESQQRERPGQEQVQQASDSMKNAADKLQEQKSDNAERQQVRAEKELEDALKEIEERLNQLREETREEKLKRLEARFREMLDRQQVATSTTIEMHDKKTNLGQNPRRDQLTVLRLATEELELSELGKQAYDLLLEDGTSEVFPEIVQNLSSDLTQAGQLLQGERTDPITQLLQRDIEATLLELLDALQESQQNRDGQGGGGGEGSGDQPLIKLLAELKMLRAEQQRVNRRTIRLDALAREETTGRSDVKQAVEDLADQQARLQEMAEKIMEKNDQ